MRVHPPFFARALTKGVGVGRKSEGLLLEPESIPVSEFTSCGAPPRARVYSCERVYILWGSSSSQSLFLRETHRIQGLVYLFTLQGSGQAPLWYTPEKITVPKA
ncbi:hypothetical protein EVAR_26423_1 [Eumeta japonica]|uniref:Uncharacterized protein n=1 Tax=Eumeta variegata TaxID=151549 RepID=A0A4C1VRF8_EUMVA|nr:hypothetical protein EVAR_26423_1 [Eumeta japonica]